MTRCPYLADKECKEQLYCESYELCHVCLLGRQADELSLLNSAIGNLTASIEERLCKEEHE